MAERAKSSSCKECAKQSRERSATRRMLNGQVVILAKRDRSRQDDMLSSQRHKGAEKPTGRQGAKRAPSSQEGAVCPGNHRVTGRPTLIREGVMAIRPPSSLEKTE